MSGAATPASVVLRRRLDWRDTDASGHWHHSVVIHWVEAAEALLQQRLGLPELYGRVPRVHYEVDYAERLWFRDVVDVALAVESVGTTSVTYAFEVRRVTAAQPGAPVDAVAASGRLVTVHAEPAVGAGATPWPQDTRERMLTAGPLGGDDLA